jgi:uncharacterized protein YrrD
MMRQGKDLENKPIISITDGRMLGRAKDVYVDANLTGLAGLYIGSEGVIRRRAQVIQSEDVVLFGIDVIMVKNTDVIKKDNDIPQTDEWYRLKDLQGYEVHTAGGTKLGTVGDIILNETGAITGLSLSRVFVKGPLAEQGEVARETVVESSHKEEIIRVDLAMLEGMAAGIDEKSLAAEARDSEQEEEIRIDVVDSDEAVDAPQTEDLPEPGEPEEESPAAVEVDDTSDELEE